VDGWMPRDSTDNLRGPEIRIVLSCVELVP